VPDLGQPQSFLVTPQSPGSTDGKDTLWVIIAGPPPAAATGDVTFFTLRYQVG
jgi:hypothetical protein